MSVTRDIPRAWVRPTTVMREHLARGVSEDRNFWFLLAGCAVVFVAQTPRLAREAYEAGQDVALLMGGALMGWLFVAPFLFYGLAALAHLAARPFGGRGTWASARLATFWAFLAASPAFLLHGLTAGFVGPGPELQIVGAVVTALFLWVWLASMAAAERRRPA